MIYHLQLGTTLPEIRHNLRQLIAAGEITLGGYKTGKIYGTLKCKSGKRMKMENRVFFRDKQEAIDEGYRPCGNCMPEQYKAWKNGQAQYSNHF